MADNNTADAKVNHGSLEARKSNGVGDSTTFEEALEITRKIFCHF